MDPITNPAEENFSKKVKVDFQYFIQSAVQKNISWNNLAISLTDLAPTLNQSRQVIKMLVQELENWVNKAENEIKHESNTQDSYNQVQASNQSIENTKSIVHEDVKTDETHKSLEIGEDNLENDSLEPVSENESIHNSTLESENLSDRFKALKALEDKVTTVESEENMEIQCNECDKTFDKDTIKLHIKRVHLKSLEFSCDQCEFVTREKRFLLGHKWSHHEEGAKLFLQGPQRCEKCGSYRCICKLKRHDEIVHQQIKN